MVSATPLLRFFPSTLQPFGAEACTRVRPISRGTVVVVSGVSGDTNRLNPLVNNVERPFSPLSVMLPSKLVRNNRLVRTSPTDPWLGAHDTSRLVVGFTYKVHATIQKNRYRGASQTIQILALSPNTCNPQPSRHRNDA